MFARIQNRDLRVLSATINWKSDVVTDFSVSVLLQSLPDLQSVRFEDIEIYDEYGLLISGFVNDKPDIRMDDSEIIEVELSCFDELGRLTLYRSRADSHYQDTKAVDIIEDLLLMTDGKWALGDISTMKDPNIATTLDLRKKEVLFAQITAVVKGVPDLHMRYGGMSGNTHLIDLGYFDLLTTRLDNSNIISDVRVKRSDDPVYRQVESYGNQSAFRRVSLLDALSDARTTAHPDYARYPIVFDANSNSWTVVDLERDKGAGVTKFFDLAKTRNDEPPDATEVAEAGFALWLKTVRFLSGAGDHETYDLDVFLSTIPLPGNRAWLKSSVAEPVLNRVTQEITYKPLFDVDQDYRIVSVKLRQIEKALLLDRVTGDSKIAYELEVGLSSDDKAELIDPELELYERLEDATAFDRSDQSLGFIVPEPVIVTHELEAADCDYDGFTPGTLEGKLFTAPNPGSPNWVNHVTVKFAFNLPNVQYRIIQNPEPNNEDGDLILCVRDSTGSWPSTVGPITLTVQYVFTK